jgi:site-specific recombinase XerD
LSGSGSAGALAPRGAVAGELVSAADELVEVFCRTLERDTTRATYRSACGRFVAWLRDRHGPAVGPEVLTLDELAAYQRELALERSPFTVRKERAALNSFLRFLLEQELVDQRQGRLALAVQGPRPKDVDGRRPIAALTERQYERLVGEGERVAAREPLLGWRDVAIVRLLGECGLRAEELTRLERCDLRPVRRGARRRELHIRHGKGARIRSVPIAGEALLALRRWDRLRVERVGGPRGQSLGPERWPLVCTLGRRRRDRSLTDPGRVCGYDTVAGVVDRLAGRADIPEELRHPHVLRHTYATRYLRRTNDLAGLQRLLGHADIRTTMRYVHVAQDELHERVERAFAREAIVLDVDGEAGSGVADAY